MQRRTSTQIQEFHVSLFSLCSPPLHRSRPHHPNLTLVRINRTSTPSRRVLNAPQRPRLASRCAGSAHRAARASSRAHSCVCTSARTCRPSLMTHASACGVRQQISIRHVHVAHTTPHAWRGNTGVRQRKPSPSERVEGIRTRGDTVRMRNHSPQPSERSHVVRTRGATVRALPGAASALLNTRESGSTAARIEILVVQKTRSATSVQHPLAMNQNRATK